MNNKYKWFRRFCLLTLVLFFISILSIYPYVRFNAPEYYSEVKKVSDDYPVAIVFGAALWGDNPSPVLQDRITAAIKLYKAGKIKKIIMSGDNRFVEYNEPQVMKNYAVDRGVLESDIVLDFAGRRTYDTCYRAKDIFGIEKAILVTQAYHLPRALYTCQSLGIEVIGFQSEEKEYLGETRWRLREIPATIVAGWQVHITRPKPILGEKEKVF